MVGPVTQFSAATPALSWLSSTLTSASSLLHPGRSASQTDSALAFSQTSNYAPAVPVLELPQAESRIVASTPWILENRSLAIAAQELLTSDVASTTLSPALKSAIVFDAIAPTLRNAHADLDLVTAAGKMQIFPAQDQSAQDSQVASSDETVQPAAATNLITANFSTERGDRARQESDKVKESPGTPASPAPTPKSDKGRSLPDRGINPNYPENAPQARSLVDVASSHPFRALDTDSAVLNFPTQDFAALQKEGRSILGLRPAETLYTQTAYSRDELIQAVAQIRQFANTLALRPEIRTALMARLDYIDFALSRETSMTVGLAVKQVLFDFNALPLNEHEAIDLQVTLTTATANVNAQITNSRAVLIPVLDLRGAAFVRSEDSDYDADALRGFEQVNEADAASADSDGNQGDQGQQSGSYN